MLGVRCFGPAPSGRRWLLKIPYGPIRHYGVREDCAGEIAAVGDGVEEVGAGQIYGGHDGRGQVALVRMALVKSDCEKLARVQFAPPRLPGKTRSRRNWRWSDWPC